MTSTHYDDESLIRYLDEPDRFEGREQLEEHVRACRSCARLLESFRHFAAVLEDRDLWESADELTAADVPQSRLREFVQRSVQMLDEDLEGERFVQEILRQDASRWRTDRRFLEPSPGLLRALLTQVRRMRNTSPSHALELCQAALEVADRQSGASDLVVVSQGDTHKEHGNTLRHLGRYDEALRAFDRAATYYRESVSAEYHLAKLDHGRALVLRDLDRPGDALLHARKAAEQFLIYGDQKRYTDLRIVEGSILFTAGDLRGARDAYLEILKSVQQSEMPETLATVFNNVGRCELALGNLESSGTYLLQALRLFSDLGLDVDRIRVQSSLGQMLVMRGRYFEAIFRLREAENGFRERKMQGEAALVSLSLAEALLLSGCDTEAASLCRDLVERFSSMRMRSRSISALAYLREAVEAERVTAATLRRVRRVLEKTPPAAQPLFLPAG